MAGPFVYLGDGGGGQAQGGNTGAVTGADGQVAGNGEGFDRQGAQANLAALLVEKLPLGAVDAAGVVGQDGLQGVGYARVGGAQGRAPRRAGGGRSAGRWRRRSRASLRRRNFGGDFSG